MTKKKTAKAPFLPIAGIFSTFYYCDPAVRSSQPHAIL